MEILVENIKCSGCVNSIQKAILQIQGTSNVLVDLEKEKITLEADEKLKETIVNKLASMGYPEKGHNNFASKAKSYVSCAVGKMTS